jgi:hypothetical protein
MEKPRVAGKVEAEIDKGSIMKNCFSIEAIGIEVPTFNLGGI